LFLVDRFHYDFAEKELNMLKNFVERTGHSLSAGRQVSTVVAKLLVCVAGGTMGWMLAYL
jgi:hypothetical protein